MPQNPHMLAVLLLSVLGIGFYAFIAMSTKEATEMMLAFLWFLMAIAMFGSIAWTILGALF